MSARGGRTTRLLDDTRIVGIAMIAGAAIVLWLAFQAQTGLPWEATRTVYMEVHDAGKLSRNADTIIIGNPDIADASVQDASTIVLTGKGFGVTNLVVLDDAGAPIIDEQVIVSRSSASTVRVYRRASVQTLSCTPYCEGSYKTDAERMSESELGGE